MTQDYGSAENMILGRVIGVQALRNSK